MTCNSSLNVVRSLMKWPMNQLQWAFEMGLRILCVSITIGETKSGVTYISHQIFVWQIVKLLLMTHDSLLEGDRWMSLARDVSVLIKVLRSVAFLWSIGSMGTWYISSQINRLFYSQCDWRAVWSYTFGLSITILYVWVASTDAGQTGDKALQPAPFFACMAVLRRSLYHAAP